MSPAVSLSTYRCQCRLTSRKTPPCRGRARRAWSSHPEYSLTVEADLTPSPAVRCRAMVYGRRLLPGCSQSVEAELTPGPAWRCRATGMVVSSSSVIWAGRYRRRSHAVVERARYGRLLFGCSQTVEADLTLALLGAVGRRVWLSRPLPVRGGCSARTIPCRGRARQVWSSHPRLLPDSQGRPLHARSSAPGMVVSASSVLLKPPPLCVPDARVHPPTPRRNAATLLPTGPRDKLVPYVSEEASLVPPLLDRRTYLFSRKACASSR